MPEEENDIALKKFNAGYKIVEQHPLFRVLLHYASVVRNQNRRYPEHGLAIVGSDGYISCNPKHRAEPEQWAPGDCTLLPFPGMWSLPGGLTSSSHRWKRPALTPDPADAYDAGYMKPEDVAGTVKVKGRGGTVLQPGIDLLEKAEDFPGEAPILIITDGYCDKVVLHGREHAFLVPQRAALPFVPKGKVFRIKDL